MLAEIRGKTLTSQRPAPATTGLLHSRCTPARTLRSHHPHLNRCDAPSPVALDRALPSAPPSHGPERLTPVRCPSGAQLCHPSPPQGHATRCESSKSRFSAPHDEACLSLSRHRPPGSASAEQTPPRDAASPDASSPRRLRPRHDHELRPRPHGGSREDARWRRSAPRDRTDRRDPRRPRRRCTSRCRRWSARWGPGPRAARDATVPSFWYECKNDGVFLFLFFFGIFFFVPRSVRLSREEGRAIVVEALAR